MVTRDTAQQAQAYVDKGLDYYEDGQIETAMQCLDRALQYDPNHGQAWYCKGAILADLEDYNDAIACYQRSAHLAPDHAHLPLFNMGNAYQELERFDLAIECFGKAIEANPEMADAWINQGRLLDDSGEHAEAVASYDEALKIDPSDSMAWANRGNSLSSLGEFKKAGRSYQEALKLDPDDSIAKMGIATCLAHLGNPEKAIKLIDQIPELPNSPPMLVDRAMVLMKLDRGDEALKSVNLALKLGGASPEVWNNRGEILASLDRPKDALESFDQSLEMDAKYPPAWFGKARLMHHQDHNDRALDCLESYFEYATIEEPAYQAALALAELCGMPLITAEDGDPIVQPGKQLPTSYCPCCQVDVLAYCGVVSQAGEEIGAYWMKLPMAHPDFFYLAIRLTADALVPPRIMILLSQISDEGVVMRITDIAETPWDDFGAIPVLSRQEGLAAHDRAEFFELADQINLQDPRLVERIQSFHNS